MWSRINSNLIFPAEGGFTFKEDRLMEYVDGLGKLYKGNWCLKYPSDNADDDITLEVTVTNVQDSTKTKAVVFNSFHSVDENNFSVVLTDRSTLQYFFARGR